jgi:hypothetical protein
MYIQVDMQLGHYQSHLAIQPYGQYSLILAIWPYLCIMKMAQGVAMMGVYLDIHNNVAI